MPPSAGVDASREGKKLASSPSQHTDADEKETCDALCSLMGVANESACPTFASYSSDCSSHEPKRKGSKACPKQLQLPMFLSKTYHMINTCDSTIATWSDSGDNFVVKNVDQFAASVLPKYFKHSNFSSFARQLNFYGFRKLRTDPILTSDVDPQTSCYVRFYHEKFQRDKPDLLHDIKRATKTDQQSKDDVDSLKLEVSRLKDVLSGQAAEYERRLAEISYDFNRRISATNAEFDKLASLVHQFIARQLDPGGRSQLVSAAPMAHATMPCANPPTATRQMPDLLHSLSQIAAVSLQNHAAAAAAVALRQNTSSPQRQSPSQSGNAAAGTKRDSSGESADAQQAPAPTRRRLS